MVNYEKLYLLLFHASTDAIDQLDAQNYGHAKEILVQSLLVAEEQYLTDTDDTDNS